MKDRGIRIRHDLFADMGKHIPPIAGEKLMQGILYEEPHAKNYKKRKTLRRNLYCQATRT